MATFKTKLWASHNQRIKQYVQPVKIGNNKTKTRKPDSTAKPAHAQYSPSILIPYYHGVWRKSQILSALWVVKRVRAARKKEEMKRKGVP